MLAAIRVRKKRLPGGTRSTLHWQVLGLRPLEKQFGVRAALGFLLLLPATLGGFCIHDLIGDLQTGDHTYAYYRWSGLVVSLALLAGVGWAARKDYRAFAATKAAKGSEEALPLPTP